MRMPTDCQIRIFAKINVELAFKRKVSFYQMHACENNYLLEKENQSRFEVNLYFSEKATSFPFLQ